MGKALKSKKDLKIIAETFQKLINSSKYIVYYGINRFERALQEL
jgi:hypothetical protein